MPLIMLPSGPVQRAVAIGAVSVAAVGMTGGWDAAKVWAGKLADGAAGTVAVAAEVVPNAWELYKELREGDPGSQVGNGAGAPRTFADPDGDGRPGIPG